MSKTLVEYKDPIEFAQMFEKVVIENDLGQLSPQERVSYYNNLCKSIGLNPLTKPFDYIKFQGMTKLYANKDCANQLRKLYTISIDVSKVEVVGKNLMVWARASLPNGRYDTDVGSVPNTGNSNDILKCMTKAKRRVTLSICGLGFLDEIETETIPNAERIIVFKFCPICQKKTFNIELDECEVCHHSWEEIKTIKAAEAQN